jgi:hypothetical protein
VAGLAIPEREATMKVNCRVLRVVGLVVLVAGVPACRAKAGTGADGNDAFFPFREDALANSERAMFEKIDPNVLAQYEADARKSLESGGIPPAWQNLAPKLTSEQCAKMSTVDLAQSCFSSSYLTRRLLAENRKAAHTLVAVTVWYPCYRELFKREDLWKGVLKAYSTYVSSLDPRRDSNGVIDGSMGMGTVRDLFQLPRLQDQVRGRELLFVRAQLDSLKTIHSYLEGDLKAGSFALGAPISLLQHTLIFMRRGAPDRAGPAISRICRIPLSRTPTTGQMRTYLDAVMPEIEQFLKAVPSQDRTE